MKKRVLLGALVCWVSVSASAAYYTWTDPSGGKHFTDKADQLPPRYRAILDEGKAEAEVNGIGYWVDEGGIYHFYEKGAAPAPAVEAPPPPAVKILPGLHNTAKDDSWKGLPAPEVAEVKVKRIVSGDTLQLENGTKLKYIGIVFPPEFKGNHPLHQEAKDYQRRLLEGQTVHVLFGPQRTDDKGRTLGYVFIGTDMFVNADLVMNGYAKVQTESPNTEYRDLFLRLEDYARKNHFGLWKSP